jgi:hypothetical protein
VGNLDTWERISRPPASALKQITGGRLNGKSDINPQWRMKAMTEEFGRVGEGWKYSIDKLWTEDGADGERMAFALVSVYVAIADSWSDPVPGIGGSMMIAKERSGLYNSDEAYKMAATDALSVAFKAFGMAAEIYMGNWDGSKYKDAPPASTPPASLTAQDQCKELSARLGLPDEEKAQMWIDSGKNWSNLLIMLKEYSGRKLAAVNATLDAVMEAGK